MNVRVLLWIVLFCSFHKDGLCATNVTLVGQGALSNSVSSFIVSTGQTAKVVSVSLISGSLLVEVLRNGIPTRAAFPKVSGSFEVDAKLPITVVGPAIISLTSGFCTIETSTADESFVPSNAVVVPADSGGPVNIILESSTDLVTWTAALPGTYGVNTTNRFFRVRAQRTP